ncbi:hypothetical protein B0187_06940 [Haemophilus paracuniculus]|uniref:Damage-inducible protein J n=1 Tax=Haemophilus paracuniculus TaxID=734 RepID=A0A1T0ARM8_9PAST|nr:type II toxin-antitoxin system RelB/DinJ family antitoxin [Haemophilus paracuniculus]OOR98988.1 hypothetical protein B0187_06940 [Haemophilus paracuniculus]
MAETYVRARVDTQLKDNATALLETLGLSMSDFIRIALTRVVLEKGVPFEMKVPNDLTRAVMADIVARHEKEGELEGVLSPEEALNVLQQQ